MRLQKQQKISYNNDGENKSRILCACTVGNRAHLLKDVLVSKNNIDHEGLCKIIDVNTNNTVAIRCGPIIKTVNIRCLVLHF